MRVLVTDKSPGIVSALRFFFTHTIDRPNLTRKLIQMECVSLCVSIEIRRLPPEISVQPHSPNLALVVGGGSRQ
jgi:hypothetical protein